MQPPPPHLLAAAAVGACATLAACSMHPTQPTTPAVGMANPASEYCVNVRKGRLEIVTGAAGNQKGLCHLPDGTVVEEWELFRSAHPQGK